MLQGKTIVAVITARGGSKGIPQKNITLCGSKPLIAWTIEAAQQSNYLTEFLLSTDDEEIANVAKDYGCPVPFMRPQELASDTAKSIPVIQHALQWKKTHEGKEFDYVMILQPTSPLRTAADIDACIEKIVETGADSVMSMVKLEDFSAAKLKVIDKDGKILPWQEDEGKESKSRSELSHVYKRNCAIYLTRVSLMMAGDMFGKDSRAYIMPPERSIDINVPFDLHCANILIKLE